MQVHAIIPMLADILYASYAEHFEIPLRLLRA